MDFDPHVLVGVFGEAATSDFARSCYLFALAAFIHSRKVAKEIKSLGDKLIAVVQADLDQQRKISSALTERVAKIETHLQLGGNGNGG